jgi:hypothetical protein
MRQAVRPLHQAMGQRSSASFGATRFALDSKLTIQ